jgi:hypothetical protein
MPERARSIPHGALLVADRNALRRASGAGGNSRYDRGSEDAQPTAFAVGPFLARALGVVVIRSSSAALVLALLFAAGGCSGSSADDVAAGGAVDSVEATHSEGQLLSTFTDFVVMPVSAAAAATVSADHVTASFLPAGCAAAAVEGTTVTYTFSGCTGPRGLFAVTGNATVAYSIDATGVETQVSASGFKVDGAVLDSLSTQGDFEVDGSTHRLSEASTAQATGRLGTAFSRQGSYALAWSSNVTNHCLALSGDWSTTTTAKTGTTAVGGYARCSSHCPALGAQIDYAVAADGLSIAFDGTTDADWSTATGKHGKVDLECTED